MELEFYVKDFYAALDEGKYTGCKCPRCNSIQFPPVYVCNECGNLKTERIEMSGNGTLVDFIAPSGWNIDPFFAEFMPYANGIVELEEGVGINCIITGITEDNAALLDEKLANKEPIPVKARTLDRGDYRAFAFELIQE
jgi:uncharacterized OB-fold protein